MSKDYAPHHPCVWFINVFPPVDIVVNNKWSLIMARRSVVPQSQKMVWALNIIVIFDQYFKWTGMSVGIYIAGGYGPEILHSLKNVKENLNSPPFSCSWNYCEPVWLFLGQVKRIKSWYLWWFSANRIAKFKFCKHKQHNWLYLILADPFVPIRILILRIKERCRI